MNELLQFYQLLLQFAQEQGGNLNIESQYALAEMIQLFTQLIEATQQQQQQDQAINQPPQPPIEPAGMPSSNVEGFAFDPENNRLYVRFLGDYPNRNGPVYSYDNVPDVIFNLLRTGSVPARTKGRNRWGEWWRGKSPSLGASVYTLLRLGGFPYQRVA